MRKNLLIISYSLAAVLGWGGAIMLNGNNQGELSTTPSKQPGRDSSTSRDPSADGDQLVEDLRAALDDPSRDPDRPGEDRFSSFLAGYNRLKTELPPAADPEKTFRDLFARLAPRFEDGTLLQDDPAVLELAVRYHQWMLEDPAAALRLLSESGPGMANLPRAHLEHLGEDFVMENGFADSLALLKTLPKDHAWVIKQHVISDLARRGSIEDLIQLEKNGSQPDTDRERATFGRQLGAAWPVERSAELLTHLQGQSAGAAAVALAGRMQDNDGLQWVLDLVNNGELDSRAVKYLADRNVANQLVDRDGVSVDERVATYQTLGIMKNQSDHFVGAMIIDWELREFMFNDDDWLFAFRHGEAGANEVLDAAMESMPDFASRRGEVASQLFRQLAEDNPDAALELIADQSPENIAWARTNSTRWAFFGVNPNDVYQWAEQTPSLDDPKQDAAFAEGWRGRSGQNLARFGEEYVQWAGELPDGPQRNMALEGIISNRNPHLAEQARSLLENGQ